MTEIREKLVQNLELLMMVEEGMSRFSQTQSDFNATLANQISEIEERQKAIQSLKPILLGNDEEVECDLGKGDLKNKLLTILSDLISRLQEEIRAEDPSDLRLQQIEWDKSEIEEKSLKSRIKAMRDKIAKKEKAQKAKSQAKGRGRGARRGQEEGDGNRGCDESLESQPKKAREEEETETETEASSPEKSDNKTKKKPRGKDRSKESATTTTTRSGRRSLPSKYKRDMSQ
jgi:hypothetical protein